MGDNDNTGSAGVGRIVGIDLGTTNTVVAVSDRQEPRTLHNAQARDMTRSAVAWRAGKSSGKGEFVVGDAALHLLASDPANTVYSIKRLMGRAWTDRQVQAMRKYVSYQIVEPSDGTKDSVRVVLGGRQFSPVDISAMILRKVKEDAERVLKETITHAVITVPAYFSAAQKTATRMAGNKAGLKIIQILDEPTAAAIAFGMDEPGSNEAKFVLVYDLGGGTFDVSILAYAQGTFSELAHAGDMWLGGENFDQELMKHVIATLTDGDVNELRFKAALKRASQETKELLGTMESTELCVPGLLKNKEGDFIDVRVEITRVEFEEMVAPLIAETIRLTRKALDDAKLTPGDINHVLLAGNATCVPAVARAVQDLFGPEKVKNNKHPKYCVAHGAAISARRLSRVICQNPVMGAPGGVGGGRGKECGYQNELNATVCARCGQPLQAEDSRDEVISLSRITPFSYGIQSAGDEFIIFVNKGDPFPTLKTKIVTHTFYTRYPNQRMISIPVYGGEDRDKASHNNKQGEAFALLPPNQPANTPVRIKLWLDVDGCFLVEARLDDGMDLKPWIVNGEHDAKAIEMLHRVETTLEQNTGFSDEQTQAVEQARNEAFDRLRRNDYEGAIVVATEVTTLLAPAPPSVLERAGYLVRVIEVVLQDFSWAFRSAMESLRLKAMIDDTTKAIEANDTAVLERQANNLRGLLDSLPESVRLILGLRVAIATDMRKADPLLADQLLKELEQIEDDLRNNREGADGRLLDLAGRAEAKLKSLRVPTACDCCGHVYSAEESQCPKCGSRNWMLSTRPVTAPQPVAASGGGNDSGGNESGKGDGRDKPGSTRG